jgi:catechol 2,3-dioxygenase-like lactoylglutathione lyase family enzyme
MADLALGLHHVGLYVADLDRSIAFYRDAFGLEVAERLSFGDEQIAFLRIGAHRLELITLPGSTARATGVVDHVAFVVPAPLETLLDALRARGVRLLDQTPIPVPALNARIAFCLGPDGERIELFEQA